MTFACLDNLDEKNKQDLVNTKVNLAGLQGVKRMARDMLRADRKTFSKPPSLTDHGGHNCLKIKCNLNWARRYIPGSAESGVRVPVGTEQSCLNHPPGRHTWVARFRHPRLKAIGKRPTRSKTYRRVITEHQSFQTVVRWLWERYSTVWNLCEHEVDQIWPMWVEEAVAECAACQTGSGCAFLEDLESKSKTAVIN